MSRISDCILNAIYPNNVVCAVCGSEAHTDNHGLCDECASLIKTAGIVGCTEYIDSIYCAIHYTKHIAAAVHNYKYNDARYLSKFFASLIELPEEWHPDAVVPIPLHPKKLCKRGYNQSELIARELCERYGLVLDESLVIRKKNTKSQRELDKTQRVENMKGAFSAAKAATGKRILILDDVYTTGSTMNECAKVLKANGALAVYGTAVCLAGYSE